MQEILKDILKEYYQKILKSMKNKRDLELVTSGTSGYGTASEKFLY